MPQQIPSLMAMCGRCLLKWLRTGPAPVMLALGFFGCIFSARAALAQPEPGDYRSTVIAARPWVADSVSGLAIGGEGRLLVSSYFTDEILEYRWPDLGYERTFLARGDPGAVLGSRGLEIGSDGQVYALSSVSRDIRRYRSTGAYDGVLIGRNWAGMRDPDTFAFGPNGDVYVLDSRERIIRFDGVTGEWKGPFLESLPDDPVDFVFGQDGLLWLGSAFGVFRYDPPTRALLDTVATWASDRHAALGCSDCMAIGPDGLLYLSTADGEVVRYDPSTGEYLGVFSEGSSGLRAIRFGSDGFLYASLGYAVARIAGASGGIEAVSLDWEQRGRTLRPSGIAFGPGGLLHVASEYNGRTWAYDPVTGNTASLTASSSGTRYVEVGPSGATYGSMSEVGALWCCEPGAERACTESGIGSGGVGGPAGIALGPDGGLYVATDEGAVLRYEIPPEQPCNVAFDRVFVAASDDEPVAPEGLAFGPDGDLYVSSFDANEVLRYRGEDGSFWGVFVSQGRGGLRRPRGLTFGPEGNLYVASSATWEVLAYDGTTGASLGPYVTYNSGGLRAPADVKFGPDADLYVSSLTTDEVLRYWGPTNATSIDSRDAGRPRIVVLRGNHPNPFVGETVIGFDLARPATVVVTVYDGLGREVRVVAPGVRVAGYHELRLETDGMAPGVYVYTLSDGDRVQSRKMVLLR